MKRVDQSLKYLCGELGPEEAREWEKALREDPGLRENFTELSRTYEFVQETLQAEDEEAFRQRMKQAMEASDRKEMEASTRKKAKARRLWIPFSAAAAAVLLGVFLIFNPSGDPIERFCKPSDDAFLHALSMSTRASDARLHALFRDGEMEELYLHSLEALLENPGSMEAAVYHLVSSLETGRHERALEKVPACTLATEDPLQQSLCWYRAMGHLKSGRTAMAVPLLDELARLPGPYQDDADKLLEVLQK